MSYSFLKSFGPSTVPGTWWLFSKLKCTPPPFYYYVQLKCTLGDIEKGYPNKGLRADPRAFMVPSF